MPAPLVTQLQRWARQGIRVAIGDPMYYAASHGKLDVVRVLIKKLGADVNQANDRGGTNATDDSLSC
jgi:ankyrin repeat protein